MKNKTYEVRFQQLNNDLYWSFCCKQPGCLQILRWKGYNDMNWLLNVAPKRKIKECKCGIKYEIDFENDEVKKIR